VAKQTINIGTTPNDGTGSTIRAGGDIVNDNFNEIYTALGDGTTLNVDTSGASNGEALVYNSVSGKFESNTVSATSTFTIAGDGGTDQDITTGDTLTVQGGTGITTTGVATDVLSIAIDSTVATLTGSQVLQNKTINLSNNTLSGTTAEFNTALSDGSFATLAGSEVLTNKDLTGSGNTFPTINIQGSDSTQDTISLGETLIINGTVSSSISGNTLTLNGFSGGSDLDQDNATIQDVGYISFRSSSNTPTKTLTVTVATQTAEHYYNGTGSTNKYVIDGDQGPALQLAPGTYRFDQSDASNSGHPLLFYSDPAKVQSYTTNVTTNGTPGSASAYTQIVIDKDTPLTLYYQCSVHAYMGHVIQVVGGFSNGNLTYTNGTFTGDGSTTTITIDSGRAVNDVLVHVNGFLLVPTDDYTISGTTLTFATAPAASAEISVRYLPLTGAATYTNDTATGDGSTTGFTIDSGRTVEDVMVSVNGVTLVPTTDYTISGTTLTFTTAPAASAEISIRYLRLT